MRFTVVWAPAAEAQLTEVWLAATDRRNISDTANQIDQDLRDDPVTVGESREPGYRIHLRPPLGVTFEILPADRIVRVLQVWHFASKRRN